MAKPDIVAFDEDSVDQVDGEVYSIPPVPPNQIPGLSGGGSGEVGVNTDMLRSFIAYLDELKAPLQHAHTRLTSMRSPATGAFHQAFDLREGVGGDSASGLRDNFRTVIDNTIASLETTREGLQRLVNDYETTEEFNELEAQVLIDAMPNLAGNIRNIQQTLSTGI